MRDFGVENAVLLCLLVQKIEQVLDGERQDLAAMRRGEDGLEQVVDELLQSSFGGKKTRQIHLGHHLGGAIDGVSDRICAAATAAGMRFVFAFARDIC